jgi:hypothetical protein
MAVGRSNAHSPPASLFRPHLAAPVINSLCFRVRWNWAAYRHLSTLSTWAVWPLMEKTSPAAAVSSVEPSRLPIDAKHGDSPVGPQAALISAPADPPAEILLLDQQLVKDLTCGICLQIITEPRQCSNGHLFCYECLQRSISATSSCPTCRCKLTEETISRSLIAEKQLRSCIVWCKVRRCI